MTFNFTWGHKSIHISYSASTRISLGNSRTLVVSEGLKFVLIMKAKDTFFFADIASEPPHSPPPPAATQLMKRESVGLRGNRQSEFPDMTSGWC